MQTIVWRSLPLAIVVTILCGLVYAAGQQILRQSANDPQIQLSEDAAAALAGGATVTSVVPTSRIELLQSLQSFIMVADAQGQVLAGNAMVEGKTPALPSGVVTSALLHGQDRITWMPDPAIRLAIVATPYGGAHPGVVVAGRSLREVELRESNLGAMVAAAWFAALAGTFACLVLEEAVRSKKH